MTEPRPAERAMRLHRAFEAPAHANTAGALNVHLAHMRALGRDHYVAEDVAALAVIIDALQGLPGALGAPPRVAATPVAGPGTKPADGQATLPSAPDWRPPSKPGERPSLAPAGNGAAPS